MMSGMSMLEVVLLAGLAGAVVGLWVLSADRRRLTRALGDRERALGESVELASRIREEAAALRARCEAFERREQDETTRERASREAFRSAAAEAMAQSSEHLLKLASERLGQVQSGAIKELEGRRAAVDAMVKPISETLRKAGETMEAMECERLRAYAELREQARAMAESNSALRLRADDLVKALRKPQVRGRYGEIQLRRVVELAGMRSYCDFDEQASVLGADGRALRPDMVVRLPNERTVVVDAKTNIEAYVDAIEAESPERAEEHLDRFARHVSEQAEKLARKEYAAQFDRAPDFIVMFVPGDQFIDAALQRRPELLDLAAQRGVILASPSTLIGLLRAVHVGWRDHGLTEQAERLLRLGSELHERVAIALGHAEDLGAALRQSVERYNKFVGSVERNLLPTVRKFEESGARSGKTLPGMGEIEVTTRSIETARAAGGNDSKG